MFAFGTVSHFPYRYNLNHMYLVTGRFFSLSDVLANLS